MKHRSITISLSAILLALCFQHAHAQVNSLLRQGNSNYDKKNYGEAEKSYNQALDKDPDSYIANFNKGDALFKQGKYKEAAGYFNRASGLEKDRNKDEQGYYNLGNSYLKQKDYAESISAYKKALKINPDDLHAKYNLSYAIAERNKQQKQQQQQNKNNQGNQKDKDKSQSAQNQQQNNTQRNNQPYQNTPSKDESGISNAEAEQILNAINNNEEKIRQRLYDNNKKGEPFKTDKPW